VYEWRSGDTTKNQLIIFHSEQGRGAEVRYDTPTNKQTYYYVVSGVFSLVAVLHLARVLSGWEAVLAGVIIPVWVSWIAVALAGYLAVRGYQFGKKM